MVAISVIECVVMAKVVFSDFVTPIGMMCVMVFCCDKIVLLKTLFLKYIQLD